MDEAKNSFSEAKKNLNDAQKAVDECLHVAARGILKGFAVAQAQAHGTYKCAIRHLDSAQVSDLQQDGKPLGRTRDRPLL